MDNDLFSILSRLMGFDYTTSTSAFFICGFFFIAGAGLMWGLHRFNAYTAEFYLSEIMPATPLERWWSGFIFGSKLFLSTTIKVSLILWIPVGIFVFFLSLTTLVLNPSSIMNSQTSRFIVFLFGLGIFIAIMGWVLFQHFISSYGQEPPIISTGRQRQLMVTTPLWIISVVMLVFSITRLFNFLDSFVVPMGIFMTIGFFLSIMQEG